MDNILSFNNFGNDSAIDLNDIFSLNENGSGVKYSKDEFKKIFEVPLNESEYIDESLINTSYAYYELSMLYESKSNWMESEGKFVYLDCDTHVILVKNGEGHMLEKSTFELSKETLSSNTWSNIENKWLSLKKVANSEIKDLSKNKWNLISYGAKKAWEFAKTCSNAAVEFGKNLSFLDWVGLTLSVLAAYYSICGTIVAGSVVASEIEPFLQEISAFIMLLNGALSIYEGSTKLNDTTVFLNKHNDITNTAKVAAIAVEVAPDYVMGFGMLCMGAHNLVEASAATAFDLTAAPRTLGVNVGIKSALIKSGKTLAEKGAGIERTVEGIAGYAIKSDIGKKIGGSVIEATVEIFGSMVLTKIMSSIWANLLIKLDAALAGISSILTIPSKISKGIYKFSKSANSTFTKILAKGLNSIVKPMTSSGEKVISKYVQPIIGSSRNWLSKTVYSYQASVKYLEKHKEADGLISGSIKKAPNPKDIKLPVNRLVPKEKIDLAKVTKKDINIIRKIQKGKSNESYEYSTYKMNHIKPFNI